MKVFPVIVRVIDMLCTSVQVEQVETNVARLEATFSVTVLVSVPLSSVTASPVAGPVVQVALHDAPPEVSDHVAPAFQFPVAMPKQVPAPVPQAIAFAGALLAPRNNANSAAILRKCFMGLSRHVSD